MLTKQKESNLENNSNVLEPSTQPKSIQIQPQVSLDSSQARQYHQEGYRWVIIALISVAFTINNLANNAIIPISSKVAKIYGLSETYANLPIQISFLINPIMNFTAGGFIDSKGLGISFRIGAVLYAIGLLGFCLINYGYHWVLIGAILIALGQPLVMNCPAKVATYWFIDKNRTVATGIISAINLVTLGVSLVFPAIFVKEDAYGDQAKEQIFSLYSKYFLAGVANCVLVIIFMRQRPERLPSAGAQQQKTTVKQTWQIIKQDKNIWQFFAAAIMLYGTFLSFGSTSNMLFKPYGFEDTQIAIFGVCLLVSGILGSVAYTVYIKKTINYKRAIVCACVLAIIFESTNALLMNLVTQQRVLISLMILGMGFNLIPMVPISYDLGCELSFPVGEAQVVGIVTGGAMIYTVILSLTISGAVGFGTPNQSAICMGIYVGLSLIGCILYCFVKINLKRRDHEQKTLQQRNSGDYQISLTLNDSAKEANLIKPLNKKAQSQLNLNVPEQLAYNSSILSQQKSQKQMSYQTGEASPQKLSKKGIQRMMATPKLVNIESLKQKLNPKDEQNQINLQ